MTIAATTMEHYDCEGLGTTSVNKWKAYGTDAAATINTAGYITGASDVGMKVKDVFDYIHSTTFERTRFTVKSITSGAANLTDGTVISSGTDTD